MNRRQSDQRNIQKFLFCPSKGATAKSSLVAWTTGRATRSAIMGAGGGDGVSGMSITGESGGAGLNLVLVSGAVNKVLGPGHSVLLGEVHGRLPPRLVMCIYT